MTDQRRNTPPQRQASGEITADAMLEHFKGSGLKAIILFTVFAHVLILGGTSVPFLWESVSGPATSSMDEKTRMENAVREATTALRDIADKYELRVQELSRQFAEGGTRRPPARSAEPESDALTDAAGEGEAEASTAENDEETSAMEKKLEVKQDGPDMPSMDGDIFD